MTQQADGSDLSPRSALVAGFGPVGRLVAEGLAEAGFAVTVLELNPATVEKHLRLARDALEVETTAQAIRKVSTQNQFFLFPRED